MTVKLGRNDLCHCGSGKKYKKCHLTADEAQEHELAAVRASERAAGIIRDYGGPLPMLPRTPMPDLAGLPPIPDRTPEEQAEADAFDAFHGRWMEADYETHLELFAEQVAGGITYDVFEMLASLFEETREHGERDRFWSLTDQLERAAPDAVEPDRSWVTSWLTEDALTRGLYERLPGLVDRLVDVAAANIDELFRLLDMLLFHGQTEIIMQVMTRAWPAVSASRDITPYGLGEFVGLLAMLQIAEYAARTPQPRPDDRLLLDVLEPLGALDQDGITLALASLTNSDHTWSAADFRHDHGAHDKKRGRDDDWDRFEREEEETIDDLLPHPDDLTDDQFSDLLGRIDVERDEPKGPPPAPVTVSPVGPLSPDAACATLHRNLVALTIEWAAHTARTDGIPYSRLELARDALIAFLDEQPPGKRDQATLLPTRKPVDEWTGAYLSPLSGRYHKGGAFYALLPSFVAFLEAKGLATHDLARRSIREVLSIQKEVRRICDQAVHDPLLTAAIDEMSG